MSLADKGDPLSPREREVVLRAALGMSTKEIGRELGTSHRTVECQLLTARAKLGVNRCDELPARLLGEERFRSMLEESLKDL